MLVPSAAAPLDRPRGRFCLPYCKIDTVKQMTGNSGCAAKKGKYNKNIERFHSYKFSEIGYIETKY
jgi:hypothetical protein